MKSIAVTASPILRVAVLCTSLLSQVFYKAGKLAGLVLVSALLLASPALAGENLAGEGTVAEWRANLGRSEVATECKNPRTVRELHAYLLLYRALPTLMMKQAIWNFLSEADCTMMSEDRFMLSNFPQMEAQENERRRRARNRLAPR